MGRINNNDLLVLRTDETALPIRFCPTQTGTVMDNAGSQGPPAADWNSSYYMNPHWSYTSYPGATGDQVVAYRKLTDYPNYLAMICEDLYGSYVPHRFGGSASWNLLYRDGHVASVADSYVGNGCTLATLGTYTTGGINGPITDLGVGTAGGTNFSGFDSNLDILEVEALGGNPAKEFNVFPGGSLATGSNTKFWWINREATIPAHVNSGTANWD